jgi:glycosyltransferase involved in cell wall biosynthesis
LIVGIDAHALGNSKSGNETYYEQLLKHLLSPISNGIHYVIYYTHAKAAHKIQKSTNVRLKRIRPSSPVLRIPYSFPLEIRREQLDLFHAQFIIPPFCKCKTVTTIPDIAYEHFPDLFSPFETFRSKLLIRRSARSADHIITVSNYSKADLARTYDIDPSKITVTYEAAGDSFTVKDCDACKEHITRAYGIRDPFVLYVGRLQARKNLPRLLRAFARLKAEGIQHRLVLVGKRDWMFERIFAQVRALQLEPFVTFTGYVPSEDLPLFYGAADVFVYPSLFEGFGLPVIEAMACGTPVVTSFGSSLEEIAGDAAVLVDPHSEDSIVNGLRRVLADRALTLALRDKGLRRSREFHCDYTARQTVEVYQRVMGAA